MSPHHSLCLLLPPQARKRGQLNANFVAAAAAGSGYGSDDEGVRRMAAAVDAATGAPGTGYDSDDAGKRLHFTGSCGG